MGFKPQEGSIFPTAILGVITYLTSQDLLKLEFYGDQFLEILFWSVALVTMFCLLFVRDAHCIKVLKLSGCVSVIAMTGVLISFVAYIAGGMFPLYNSMRWFLLNTSDCVFLPSITGMYVFLPATLVLFFSRQLFINITPR